MKKIIAGLAISLFFIGCNKKSKLNNNKVNKAKENNYSNRKIIYSDNEILDFAISKGELAENTVKLKEEPSVGEDILEKPIFFVYIESRPNNRNEELDEEELSTKEYYRIYFGQNYGDHVARYETLFLKYDLSEAYSSEDIIFDKNDEIIYKKNK